MGHDWNATLTVEVLKEMGVEKIFDPGKVIFVMDHGVPSPTANVSALQKTTEEFARSRERWSTVRVRESVISSFRNKVMFYQVMVIVGSDSHTTTYGALNACLRGGGLRGSCCRSGIRTSLVPGSRIDKNDSQRERMRRGVSAKDLILYILGKVTAEEANYKAVEFCGDGVDEISVSGRLTICNMGIEMGAKVALFEVDSKNKRMAF